MSQDPTPIDAAALEAQADRLRALATSLVRDFDRAEDVVQETCLRALAGAVKPRRSLGACLTGVVRNVAWTMGRGDARRSQREAARARPEAEPSTLEMLARLDEQRAVLDCVRSLPEPYRATILMRFFEDLPPREIARRTHTPVETVKTRQKRALQLLRRALDRHHGGERRTWLATLAPIAGFDLLGPASSATNSTIQDGGTLMAQATGMKMALAVVTALLLIGGVWALDLLGRDDAPGTDHADLRGAEEGTAERASPAEAPTLASADDAGAPADGSSSGTTGGDTAVEGGAELAGKDAAGEDPVADARDPLRVKPAVRRSPFGLPKRSGTARGFGGMGGPTGHWTRFGMPPMPKGSATFVTTVRSEDGKPIPNARVFIGPPDLAGTTAISLGDIREIGRTNARGVLEATALPDGGVAVFANVDRRLNGPRGLDGRSGVATILDPRATTSIEVTLPLVLGDVGRVRGQVLTASGAPARAAQVGIGYQSIWTRADGRFDFQGVPVGARRLRIELTGHTGVALDVNVQKGVTIEREVRLDHEEAGSVRLEGTMRGPDGETVPNAIVYFILVNDRDTARSVRTDVNGRYVFEKLPDRVKEEPVRLQGSAFPRYEDDIQVFEKGLTKDRIDFALPTRYVQLRIDVLDADTNESVEQLRVSAHRAESKRPNVFITKGPDTHTRNGMAEPGTHTFKIEALDHQDLETAIDVQPDANFEFHHTIKLKRTNPSTTWINLTVLVTDATTGQGIETLKIDVQDKETRETLSRFGGTREGGEVLMPGPSGERRIVVTAEGYEPSDTVHDLKPDPGAATVRIRLRSK